MIALFTDYGPGSLYVGQVKAVLERDAPGHPVIDLMHDAPATNIRPAAFLLERVANFLQRDAIVLAVVDPTVGSARAPCIVTADGRRFVGPDNGLFEMVMRCASDVSFDVVTWKPPWRVSDTFHGRDLFAPTAARLALSKAVKCKTREIDEVWRDPYPNDLPEIIYIDGFGNAMTGVRTSAVPKSATIEIGGWRFEHERIFAQAGPNIPFWYGNSLGLVEVAVGFGSAAKNFDLKIGMEIAVCE